MDPADNKARPRRYIEEAWNQGNLAVVDELFAADYVNHDPSPGQPQGTEGLKTLIASFRDALPDLHLTIDDLIAEDGKVVTRWTAQGAHERPLLGVPPTGKQLTVTTIAIDRFSNGQITHHWANRDDLGLLQQLGLMHIPGPDGQ